MKKKALGLVLALLMLLSAAAGCTPAETPVETPAETPAETPVQETPAAPVEEPPAEPVILTVAGSWEDCKAIVAVGRAFTAQYPNCSVVYESLQDYYASLEKRMTGEEAVDLFFTNNIQEGNTLLPYAFDINSSGIIDLSETFDGLIENFAFLEGGARSNKLYAIPLGAELRGLYVNKTLLDSLNIPVPTDQKTLLEACAVLKENGYIPFHGNPGDFSQILLYPWMCNLIANAEDPQAAFDLVNARGDGMLDLLGEPYRFLYTLVENDYYDYKRAQTELNLFTETTDAAYARDFLNIRANGDAWEKFDDVGQVAFLPSPMSMQSAVDKTKDDYHSEIEYLFIPAPVGPDGAFAYMSPAHAIGINKESANLEWSERFINFLFQPENNQLFAEEFNIVPNTQEAFEYIRTLYDIPDERISHLGQVTFDFSFFDAVRDSMVDMSKGNNPKYMQTNADGSVTLYPLDYYLEIADKALKGDE